MERVEELQREVDDAVARFRHAQQRKWTLLEDTRKTLVQILLRHTEAMRQRMQEYFEERNRSLHTTLINIDEALNKASEVHASMCDLRSQVVEAFNQKMKPEVTIEEGSVLLNGTGVNDLQNTSSQTEQCVLQINMLQERYSSLMDDIECNITQKVERLLGGVEKKVQELDQERNQEVSSIVKSTNDELEKAIQVLQSMQHMKQQMEELFQILRKPNTTQ
ncbi:uncharacterized protein [Cherax quadricarinatus]|uniref:uncharacterized protein n=1 Tax=Cherax quadricarinatus TaxID=27406 RepID=UPI00387E9488